MNYRCRISLLGNSSNASGSSDACGTVMFGKTFVHEFHISYSHTELNLLSSLIENGNKMEVECC